MENLQQLLDAVAVDVEPERGAGRVADYIPALARVDPRRFGMAAVTLDGRVARVGDAQTPFSLQSISKIFGLTLALELVGRALWQRVGREPSGSPFNSLVQLEHERGIPRNPLINAGALVVTDTILSRTGNGSALAAILDLVQLAADDPTVGIDPEVAASERESGHRNRALAHFIRSFGNLENEVDAVLDVYFRQCALAMNCVQLARSLLYLANGGVDPVTGRVVVSARRARRINAIMLTCGHYDASGDFAFRIGLPGKSGVGGGIVAIVPGRMVLAAWSPGLNAQGNSIVAAQALECFTNRSGLSIFA